MYWHGRKKLKLGFPVGLIIYLLLVDQLFDVAC